MSNAAVPEIEYREVWKTFPRAAEPTLAGLNMSVQPKTIHVLVGHSGAGKSVTLKHVLGLVAPDDGDILVRGESLLKLSSYEFREKRRLFGMLFQNSALFDSLNVFENIAFPLREHRRELSEKEIEQRVEELLEKVELSGTEEKMPSELSGGMRKRVGLARALALDPKILLFDEPTTGLDPQTSQIIDDLIVKTTRSLEATSLIISHDIHAALRIGDFVSMIWKGRIIESAPPKDFVRSSQDVVQRFLKSAGVI